MTELDIKDETTIIQKEYKALKQILGEMLLEHKTDDCAEDIAYYTRKFEEARKRAKR